MLIDEIHEFIAVGHAGLLRSIEGKGTSEFKEHVLNSRDQDGTNLLGKIFRDPNLSVIQKIEIATIAASMREYQVNSYLNNRYGMDCINSPIPGGLTLLHQVIFLVAEAHGSKEEIGAITKFFETLQQRNLNADSDTLFNPNYPTMNPSNFENTDYHMISTSLILDKLGFKSLKIQKLCKKHFAALQSYYDAREYEDSSGDSDNEASPAASYKKHLLEFDGLIKTKMGAHTKVGNSKTGNDTRSFDQYKYNCSIAPASMQVFDQGQVNQSKWDQLWSNLNHTEEQEQLVDINDLIVPLFHGVPFMRSQYTNHQRREVAKKFAEINKKLIGKYTGSMTPEEYNLTKEEEILLHIHSRTSTTSSGMQSLYEMVRASLQELQKLEGTDKKLFDYFRNPAYQDKLKLAMKHYIFDFDKGKTKEFWKYAKESNAAQTFPDSDVIKYRFPIIASSKTPDHPAKFSIGNNVEGATRGETAMEPDYIGGKPLHRLAGFMYVTLHKLKDLMEGFNQRTVIDVNREINLGTISYSNVFEKNNLSNQLECDFLGKMTGEVVAIIPIVYPHVRANGINPSYHQAIWGINPTPSAVSNITSPKKIQKDLQSQPNPDVGNKSSFGKVMLPTIVNLANGVAFAVTTSQGKFLCSITENRDLKPYNLKFDYQTSSAYLSYMQREITNSPQAVPSLPKNWEKLASKVETPAKAIEAQKKDPVVEDLVSAFTSASISTSTNKGTQGKDAQSSNDSQLLGNTENPDQSN